MRTVLFILVVLTALFFMVMPASSLDTVEQAFCVCVDGVMGSGDYVSCLAKMTRRLVASGAITQDVRSALMREAAATDLIALQDFCDSLGGSGDMFGFGTGFSVRDAFCPAASPSGPDCGIIGKLRMWNFTDDDIWLVSRQGGDPDGCLFRTTVHDSMGRVVRNVGPACTDALTEHALPMGAVWEYDLIVPMYSENADPATGLVNGQKLPNGIYEIRIDWILSGPEKIAGTWIVEGDYPAARVPVRVGGSPTP